MQGNPIIIDALNRLLGNELAAMDQYLIHSEMYLDWGLHKLHARIAHEFEDEKSHALTLIRRILFLQGTPDMKTREPIQVGRDVPTMLENDLKVEISVTAMLKEAIALCEKHQDFVTRKELLVLLDDTEMDHAHYLEQQLRLIQMMGLQNYLQSQMGQEAGTGSAT